MKHTRTCAVLLAILLAACSNKSEPNSDAGSDVSTSDSSTSPDLGNSGTDTSTPDSGPVPDTSGPNRAPVWAAISTITFSQGLASELSVTAYVSDPDGDALTLTINADDLPSGVSFDTAGQRFTYDGAGAEAATTGHILTASDGRLEASSQPFGIEIIALPYNLPGPGTAVAIGTNTSNSITPPNMAQSLWGYALFNPYGGGAFVADYSPRGAWVIAGSGGHGAPGNLGAAVFDFTDATWKRIDPQGGNYSDTDWNCSATDGPPHYELTGTGGVPAPAHPYQTLAPMPASIGGGALGSVVYVTRTAICNESLSSPTVHRFDLATGVWSRQTTSMSARTSHDGSALFDAARNLYWHVPNDQNNYNSHQYLDATDWEFKFTPTYALDTNNHAAGRIFMHDGLLMRQGLDDTLWAYDHDNPAPGWQELNVNGTLPNNDSVFAPHPPSGAYYWVARNGGNLVRLTPPANPITGTWVVDTVDISPQLPGRTGDGGDGPSHYNSLFYVPAIERLAWVPGGNQSVYLINPAP